MIRIMKFPEKVLVRLFRMEQSTEIVNITLKIVRTTLQRAPELQAPLPVAPIISMITVAPIVC